MVIRVHPPHPRITSGLVSIRMLKSSILLNQQQSAIRNQQSSISNPQSSIYVIISGADGISSGLRNSSAQSCGASVTATASTAAGHAMSAVQS